MARLCQVANDCAEDDLVDGPHNLLRADAELVSDCPVEPEPTGYASASPPTLSIATRATERGITLHVLAELAGVDRKYMERVLARRSSPTADWLTKIASALECSPSELLP